MAAKSSPDEPSMRSGKDEVMLGLLTAIERDSGVTQRSVAHQLGIAVGLANTYIKRCARKGLIKVTQAPARRFAYYLTPKGFAEKSHLTAQFLRASFQFMRRAQGECEELLEELEQQKVRRLMLFGSGDLTEVMLLLARERAFRSVETADEDGTPKKTIARCGKADMYIVTCLTRPLEYYEAALDAFGPERVRAPSILRLPDLDSLGHGKPSHSDSAS